MFILYMLLAGRRKRFTNISGTETPASKSWGPHITKAIYPGLTSKLVASLTGQTIKSSDCAPSDYRNIVTNTVMGASWEKDFLQ